MPFKLHAPFKPAGGQAEAIESLAEHAPSKQTLLGITGSGKSLDYDEILLVSKADGTIEKVSIGEYVERSLRCPVLLEDTEYEESTAGDLVVSFNPETKSIEEKRIIQVSKHKESKLYEIVLDDNTTVKVTKDHNCFIFENGDFMLKSTQDLRIGEYLPLSNVTFIPQKALENVNLLNYNAERKVNIEGILYLLDEEKLLEALHTERKSPRWKLSQIRKGTKERGISHKVLEKVLELHGLNLADVLADISIITKGKDTKALIDVDADFLTLCGLYVAEGHGKKELFMISNGQSHLLETVRRACRKIGVTATQTNKYDLRCYSTAVCGFLSTFGTHAGGKQIPSVMYNLSDPDLGIFLRAMFDGDGWVEPGAVLYCSKSRMLVDDLRRLLLRFKITTRVREKTVRRSTFYNLTISGKQNLLRYIECIGFSIGYKAEAARLAIRESENTNVDLVPGMGAMFSEFRKERGLLQRDIARAGGCEQSYVSMVESGQRLISQQIMGSIAQWIHEEQLAMPELRNLSYFNFRRIVDIREIQSSNGYVYDIAVEDNETFAVGGGNILVHNTFVMAQLIAKHGKPTLVLAHNKTLAAQLYQELREFFPENRVEYFISYYDYYQPESYMPTSDTYIEKEATINAQIEKMRLRTTAALLSRDDVIVVASISCIYGLSNPADFKQLSIMLEKGKKIGRQELISHLVAMQYERSVSLEPGKIRVRGDVIDIIPGYDESIIRVELFGDEIERLSEVHHITGDTIGQLDRYELFAAKQFVVPEEKQLCAIEEIKEELAEHLPTLPPLEQERLSRRVKYDIEMMQEMGYCPGIENYSRHFDGRKPGEPPYVLLDYFPKDFLMIIDESHQTIPQSRAMYKGDFARKKNLVDFGFRLPCAFDNRPLKFEEFERYFKNALFVSATPAAYEREESTNIVELIIRPTGLLDPTIEVRQIEGQIKDLLREIAATVEKGERVLVTTLTKRMAEDLTDYLSKEGVRVRYMHAEVESLDRIELVRQLRAGEFDVLVGINLLREGLDLPEVSLVAILDADKEGYLRNDTSLIQTIGRAARNVNGRVIMYADSVTESMKRAIDITRRRRSAQEKFNAEHGITPQTIIKKVAAKTREIKGTKHLSEKDVQKKIAEIEAEMFKAAEQLDFEKAIELRDVLKGMRDER